MVRYVFDVRHPRRRTAQYTGQWKKVGGYRVRSRSRSRSPNPDRNRRQERTHARDQSSDLFEHRLAQRRREEGRISSLERQEEGRRTSLESQEKAADRTDDQKHHTRVINEYKLRVLNISQRVQEAHIEEIMSTYGEVLNVRLAPPHKPGRPAFATVTFREKEQARKAYIYMDGGKIDGQFIKIEYYLEYAKDDSSS